jgi:16S rRNA (guanine966-N2)-methyltransferase
MNMRVISGIAKGRKLSAPRGTKVRPTSDKVKEAIFNTIAPFIEESNFLDLFAGSGNVGIEALSRGAKHCTFIDIWTDSIKYIKLNVNSASFQDRSTIIKGDIFKILKKLDTKYDIIFMDPPYGYNLINSVIEVVNDKLTRAGIVIVEAENSFNWNSSYGELKLVKISKYGDTQVGYLRF